MSRTNMSDNIDSMDSLMTIFGCDLYVIEHLLMCLGDCYYLDLETQQIYEAYCLLTADENGKIEISIFRTDDKNKNSTISIEPSMAYITVSKIKEDLEALIGK